MCGIVAIAGPSSPGDVERMSSSLAHRGPDDASHWRADGIALGHRRLSIIDLSDAAAQPMTSHDGRHVLVFNGELYNYLELRRELEDYGFTSRSDTEVVLAAWQRWGTDCLDRFIGMFAFAVWDTSERALSVVRDRFGVKPAYYARTPAGGLAVASEIKALHTAGIPASPDLVAWASYLVYGLYDHSPRTFWSGVSAVPAGSILRWHDGEVSVRRWYDLPERTREIDRRDESTVSEEYRALLADSVRLRFRSDVPVGINLSGGLDSSTLLALVHAVQGADSDVRVFTFATGDPSYDELPWVRHMLERTRHPLEVCTLTAEDVPELAREIATAEDEPYGGLPTLAYSKLFRRARQVGTIVLLDGQGMDEQWAGYDYYRRSTAIAETPTVQGANDAATRPSCVAPELARLAEPLPAEAPYGDRLRDLQYRDLVRTKIPRALRFNDRVSMAASTELREPFLDHRLVELAIRQPEDRKIRGDVGKRLLRDLVRPLLPAETSEAPKRPVQTPQREWLRDSLQPWANTCIEAAFERRPEWFEAKAARAAWRNYVAGNGDNSFWVWQWISIGMAHG